MKHRRFSIATLGVVVAVVALDCAWMRHVNRSSKSLLGLRGPALDAGALPIVSLLLVGVAHVLIDRGRPYRASVGPLVGGLAGLSLYLGYNFALIRLDRLGTQEFAVWSMGPIYYVARTWLGSSIPDYLYWADAVYYTPPQLLVAAVVAALFRWTCRASGIAPDPAPVEPVEEIR